MIKITMVLPDRHGINLQKLMAVAVDFRKEDVPNPAGASVVQGGETALTLSLPKTDKQGLTAEDWGVKPNGAAPIKRHRVSGQTMVSVLLEKAGDAGIFHKSDAVKWMTEAGYSPNGVAALISRLVASGKIRHTGLHVYSFVKAPATEKKVATRRKKPAQKKGSLRVAKAV